MIKYFFVFLTPILLLSQDLRSVCGTESRTLEELRLIKPLFNQWSLENVNRVDETVHILVKFHVIHASDGEGNIPDQNIYEHFDWVNESFSPHNIVFTIVDIDRSENDEWFVNHYGQDAWPVMQELAEEPYYYLNVYSADLEDVGVWGWSYLGNGYAATAFQQSVNIHYTQVAYGRDTGVHEIGHHLGLDHTFSGSCSLANDGIDDTPAMDEDANTSCDETQDSCPDLPGLDPVHNYMNYSSNSCTDNFTQGQDEWMDFIITNYHPGYLTHDVWYPNLYIDAISMNQDTDGDGNFNPGDTAKVRINLANLVGATAENVRLVLSSSDPRLTILDNLITFTDSIPANSTSFNFLDWFEVYADPEASLGNIECIVYITTSDSDYPYYQEDAIQIPITLSQTGFPTENITIKSSPIITDLNGDLFSEIYFGADDGNFYGFDAEGTSLNGFPFNVGADVRSSPAVGDVDGDGDNEIVFGSSNGRLSILNNDGSENSIYQISGLINGSPALYDLDGDGDLEIVFTSDYNSSGKVYAIHHNGEDFENFPVDIGEKMLVGAAVNDLDADGLADIVVCTWGEKIHVINVDGSIKQGFPFISNKRFNTPATLVDLDLDGKMEIVAGNDNGLLHVLKYDGTEMFLFDTGDDIRGGISVSDLNDDGSLELLFSGYDDLLHAWNPIDGIELAGWPVDLGDNSLTEPITVDLDNDGDLEVIAANKNGILYVFHHDGTPFSAFPMSLAGGVESTPVVSDLDRDGDYEIAVGTTMGLVVIDVKKDMGDRISWKLHRGNMERTGSMGIVLLSNDNYEPPTPKEFYVSPSYPNPFNPSTSINIYLIESNNIKVSIYDALGRLVNTIKNKNAMPGNHTFNWTGSDNNGSDLPTGVYFVQVLSGANVHTQKVLLIK